MTRGQKGRVNDGAGRTAEVALHHTTSVALPRAELLLPMLLPSGSQRGSWTCSHGLCPEGWRGRIQGDKEGQT